MPPHQFIEFRRNGGRIDLTFKAPPRNILTSDILEEAVNALLEYRDDDTVKVMLLRGSGDHFCSGVDYQELTAERIGLYMPLYTRFFDLINSVRGLTLCAVQGEAFGPGSELAAFCDITFAARSARFCFPDMKAGLFPSIAAAVLPRLAGRNRTLDWIVSSKIITAAEAAEAQMVARILPDDELDAFVDDYALRIASHSTPAIQLAKRAVDKALYSPVMEALKITESTFMLDLMNCIDPHEGIAATIENRAPQWKNR
ncbi:MAG: hypothetical protein FJY67_10835 [Calditrichaeota bacterium]|nr:hypothetical protein [Calditrichota bacterium]